MKFGLFDHVEDGERPLATLFDERLVFARAADDAGIYCLHVAEHHATPLENVARGRGAAFRLCLQAHRCDFPRLPAGRPDAVRQ